LWLLVAILLLRGVGSVVASQDVRDAHRRQVAPLPSWPDDAARAVAVEFATDYLTHGRGEHSDAAARRLNQLASSQIIGELVPRFDEDAPRQDLRSATVARIAVIDDRHALVTVAATLTTGDGVSVRRLTVPVARDKRGGVMVNDLPSFTAAAARAASEPRTGEPLIGRDRAAIDDVLRRFLSVYLSGDTGGLAYLVAPGVRIAAAAGRFELRSLVSVTRASAAPRGRLDVLATVEARDVALRTQYTLRYRLGLVRRDRWYVVDVNPGRSR
jgi:hypothetical protein